MTTTCAVPGCNATLNATTTSGVCRTHNHHRDFCGCYRCRTRRGERPAEAKMVSVKPRHVPSFSTGTPRAATKSVTPPAAPWEAAR